MRRFSEAEKQTMLGHPRSRGAGQAHRPPPGPAERVAAQVHRRCWREAPRTTENAPSCG